MLCRNEILHVTGLKLSTSWRIHRSALLLLFFFHSATSSKTFDLCISFFSLEIVFCVAVVVRVFFFSFRIFSLMYRFEQWKWPNRQPCIHPTTVYSARMIMYIFFIASHSRSTVAVTSRNSFHFHVGRHYESSAPDYRYMRRKMCSTSVDIKTNSKRFQWSEEKNMPDQNRFGRFSLALRKLPVIGALRCY